MPDPDSLADGLLDEFGSLEQLEALLLDRALLRHGGKLAAAARSLGMGRGQMQYRLSKQRQGAAAASAARRPVGPAQQHDFKKVAAKASAARRQRHP